MKKEILEVLHKNVEVSLAIEQNVILEWDFEKVADELDTLFAEHIVIRQSEQLKRKEVLSYSEYKEKWFEKKEGIIYLDKLTTEFVDINVILNKYQEYCNRL